VRNHSEAGTFDGLIADLDRIASMNVDVLWIMPHYPCGREARKGSLGSPYCIEDYRGVNPEFGTVDDFSRLVKEAHARGLRLMIDIVFNHTSRDSKLWKEKGPGWFKVDAAGQPTSPWTDVADLTHADDNDELVEELISSLEYWAELGVDGFRCDVAPLVPLRFWHDARARLDASHPGLVWLAESCDPGFVLANRKIGPGLCDSQLLDRAFDLVYDYDLWNCWCECAEGAGDVRRYLEMLRFQEAVLPKGAGKMRFVENHDQQRVMGRIKDARRVMAWTAFAAFNRGAFLVYAGQEDAAMHAPSLFEKDTVEWSGGGAYPFQPMISALGAIKKREEVTEGELILLEGEPAVLAAWVHRDRKRPSASGSLMLPDPCGLLGIFNVAATAQDLSATRLPLEDGVYSNLLAGSAGGAAEVRVEGGVADLSALGPAAILEFTGRLTSEEPVYSPLLDYRGGAAIF